VIAIAPPVVAVSPSRDNLSQFPASAARVPEPPRPVDVWNETAEQIVSLDSALDGAGDAKVSADAIGQLSAANDSLVAQLAAADAARSAMRDDLEAERRGREEERARLVQDIAAAAAKIEAMQSSLAAREQEHAQALAEQHARLEAGQSGVTAREQERAQLLAQLAEEQVRYQALQSSLTKQQHDHDRALAELAEQQTRCEALQTALAAREDDRARATAELAEQQARHDALQASFAAREQELARALAELNEQQGWHETLQSALAAREHEHARALAELAVQQERYDGLQASFAAREQEHVRAVAELVALRNQLESLQASISVREDEHARAFAEQKAGYDAVTAELLQASIDQQAEYQILMDERAADREAERLRGEATALEFARLEEEATQERERLELRYLDVHARLEAAQSLCAAQEARDRGLRRELEKLAAMVTTLIGSSTPNQEAPAKQAVA
jgi:DNA repair exonuclease SbcCD ATPase subunit